MKRPRDRSAPTARSPLTPLEMWAGIECTRNRVGNTFFDQLELGGHVDRLSDLRLVAQLGVRTLRYPGAVGASGSRRAAPRELGMGG